MKAEMSEKVLEALEKVHELEKLALANFDRAKRFKAHYARLTLMDRRTGGNLKSYVHILESEALEALREAKVLREKTGGLLPTIDQDGVKKPS